MSLEQLQKQIEVATVAMEKAAKSGNKSTKARLKKELAKFQKVLDDSFFYIINNLVFLRTFLFNDFG